MWGIMFYGWLAISFSEKLLFNNFYQSQYGKLRIFLPLRFYVKSIFKVRTHLELKLPKSKTFLATKLISHEFRVAEKFSKFHTVVELTKNVDLSEISHKSQIFLIFWEG